MKMKIKIKNMVCDRCIKVVREEFEKLNLTPLKVELGEVEVAEKESEIDFEKLEIALKKEGFELLKGEEEKKVEEIKKIVLETLRNYDKIDLENISFPDLISKKLNRNYASLSSLFSKKTGTTIKEFIIVQKIELAKELLAYGDLTFSEIAFLLGYKSVQHISRQFKRVTGVTAKDYLSRINKERKPIDKVI